MKNWRTFVAVVFGMIALGANLGLAQNTTPSSKAAVLVGDALVPATCGVGAGWATIFQVDMRNSG